jgi:hypothetical protein
MDLQDSPEMQRTAAFAAAIVLLLALQVWITGLAYRHSGGTWQDLSLLQSMLMVASGALQTVLLVALYRTMQRPMRSDMAMMLAGAFLMLVLSFASANTYPDALAYIAYAKMAHFTNAYAPVPIRFHGGGFEGITARWGFRLPALDYGPLWLIVDRLTIGRAPTLSAAFFELRVWNALWLFALFGTLRALRIAPATLAVAILNPALYYYYIVQAHNDLFGILLIVAGMLVARRFPLLGAFVAGSAGLVKITLALVALIACSSRARALDRLAFFCVVTAVVAGGSFVFGGESYIHALTSIWHAQTNTAAGPVRIARIAVHASLAAIAIAAAFLGLFGKRFSPLATYTFGTLAPVAEPNYLGWCTPYALRIPNFAGLFFSSLPAIAHLIDAWFPIYAPNPYAIQDWYCALLLVALAAQSILRRRRYVQRPGE